MNLRKFGLIISVILLVFSVSACGPKEVSNAGTTAGVSTDAASTSEASSNAASNAETSAIQIQDDLKRTVNLRKPPEKIVPLTPTLLNLLYDVGGKASARMGDSGVAINKEAEDLEQVGHLANINIEKLISLKPDLVIGQIGLHERFVTILEQNKIPVVIFKIDTYEECIARIQTMSQIVGKEDTGRQIIKDLDQRIKAITDKLPNEKKRIAIVYVTPQDVAVELEESIAGGAANILKFENVAVSNTTKDMKKAPFSMEELVAQNPDIIFLTSYAMTPEIKQKMNTVLIENPAWKSIKAVQAGKVFTLPPSLFAVNPVTHYDQSVEYLARLTYPEIYGNVQE